MGELLLRIVLSLFANTRIAVHAEAHPEFAAFVQEAAQAHHVPQTLLLAVGVHESGLGSNARTPFPWGVLRPAMRAYCTRADARCTGAVVHDQIEASAHVLRVGYERCGSWIGALRRYYSGACWTQRHPSTRAGLRTRAQRRRFYQRLQIYRQAVRYGERVWHSAQRFEAQARSENRVLARSLQSLRATP